MNMTIQDAIKAMRENKICYRIFEKTGEKVYYRIWGGTLERSLYIGFSGKLDKVQEFSEIEIFAEYILVEQKEEIKPCIYCSGRVICDGYREGNIFYTICTNCLANGPNVKTKASAILQHNNLYARVNKPNYQHDRHELNPGENNA